MSTQTPTPRLFYGALNSASVLETNVGQVDRAAQIDVLTKSDPLAPAGASGECIFKNVYITLTNSMEVLVRLTPVIDFVEQTGEAVDITLTDTGDADVRQTQRFEVGLSLPYNNNAFRSAMRGAWFQLKVETPNGLDANPAFADGVLILEQVELEYEVVRETLQAEN